MIEKKGIVLSAFFPESKTSGDDFARSMDVLKDFGTQVVEFYFEGSERPGVKRVLVDSGLESIFLAPVSAKPKGLHLCDIDRQRRFAALDEMKRCIEEAAFFGSKRILINGGKKPSDAVDYEYSYEVLKEAIFELFHFIEELGVKMDLAFEPGDREVDYCELVGPTDLAVRLARDIRKNYQDFYLVVDSSHLRQLGEDCRLSYKEVLDYCDHIHLANCCLGDKDSSLYGDKHPDFFEPGCEFTVDSIKSLYDDLKVLYDGKEAIVSQEIIYRGQDPVAYFERCMAGTPWFLSKSY